LRRPPSPRPCGVLTWIEKHKASSEGSLKYNIVPEADLADAAEKCLQWLHERLQCPVGESVEAWFKAVSLELEMSRLFLIVGR